MAAFLPSYFPPSSLTFRVSSTSRRGVHAAPLCQQRPNPPPSRSTPPQPLTPPATPSPPPSPAPAPATSSAAASLRRPKDPTAMRTESERRRNAPAHGGTPRRRKRRLAAGEDFDWEGAESVPLASQRASPSSGEDYWVELKPLAELRKQRRRRTKKLIDERLRSKLKSEVVSPYANNWILWAIVLVLVLALLVKFIGTDIPIISIPDV